MSAFTASTYSAEAYKAFRPSYGPSLLDLVASYHKGGNNLAVDLGCGTGQVRVYSKERRVTPLTGHFIHD